MVELIVLKPTSNMTNAFIQELFDRTQFAMTAGNGRYRMGQSLMNVLAEMDLELCRKISDIPAIDPFYDDTKISAFIAYLHIDEVIWALVKRYGFLAKFDEDEHTFVITSNVEGLSNNFFWTSNESLGDFFKSLADFIYLTQEN